MPFQAAKVRLFIKKWQGKMNRFYMEGSAEFLRALSG
jgi:hypothetical protein